ncbi:MAG: DNA alkylation repair protein [Chloroflexi bacterium]|nr:DNA alkylation repair protein [Chloroflexota bacterium]
MTSSVTERAEAFVGSHLPEARGLGTVLADLLDEPDQFIVALTDGFRRLADEEYAAEQARVAPGGAEVIGVRWPLIRATARQLRQPLRESSSATAISLAQRLAGESIREVRLFAHLLLARALPDDPERAWQVMRRLARVATDWICIDDLAELTARGVIQESFRWAELEQLVYSAHPLERRLVGATLARLPYELPPYRRQDLPAERGLELIGTLMGDADPWVQKALGWALRSWVQVDQAKTATFLRREADHAAATGDGNRAWVVRDALGVQPPAVAAEIRLRVGTVRRHADAPDTSEAGTTSAAFRAGTWSQAAGDPGVTQQQGERQQRRTPA